MSPEDIRRPGFGLVKNDHAVSRSSCDGTAQALADLFGQRLCVKGNRREGQSPALRTKKILFSLEFILYHLLSVVIQV